MNYLWFLLGLLVGGMIGVSMMAVFNYLGEDKDMVLELEPAEGYSCRWFTNRHGFSDRTMFVEARSDGTTWVYCANDIGGADVRDRTSLYPLEICMSYIKHGMWIEIANPMPQKQVAA